MIHPGAIIEAGAVLGDNVSVGPFAVIRGNVHIGSGTRIDSHAVIEGNTVIGKDCSIGTGAVIGGAPQDLKYRGEETRVVIGDNCTVREYVTINRGTSERGETRIGSRTFLMAYVHVAHDCLIGDEVILANCATMAGHVTVEEQAIIGGLTAVHQFVKIGKLSIVGGTSRITKDVVPFCKVAGNPAKISGLNVIGLMRRSYPEDTRVQLKKAYKTVFRSGLNTTQALDKIDNDPGLGFESVRLFCEFIRSSSRGICKN